MIQPIIDEQALFRLHTMLLGVSRVVLTCHLSPDGDALGSTLALCRVLRRLGKEAYVVTPDMPPKALTFLPGMRDIVVFTRTEMRARYVVEQAQLFLCLDFNTVERIDRLGEYLMANPAPKVLIDHHINPDVDFFALQFSFPDLSSTCELVFRILLQLHMLNLIDRDSATCLYTGMITDTGNFTYGPLTPDLLEMASILMRRRISVQQIYAKSLNTFSADSLRLQGYALSERMRLVEERGAALIVLTGADLERFHYHKGDTEGLVNKPLSIPGIRVSIFLREDSDHIKVSCRSVGNIDVNVICAEHFGGGGHVNAAGGELHCGIDDAIAFVERIIDQLPVNDNHSPESYE